MKAGSELADMDTIAVTVQILGKDYRIACLSHEREALLASASYLNGKMREIKNNGKVVGNESIAVMAGLNIAHELLQLQSEEQQKAEAVKSRLQVLQQRLEEALEGNSQLQI